MPLTGLFAISISPGESSPSAALVSHISRSYPAASLPTFHLDNRLFVDTSSLHPKSNVALRRSTSLLTLSQTPTTTYVATTSPKGNPQENGLPASASTPITIPSSSADSFTQLLGTKLQPLWTLRQSLVVENGASLSLRNGQWIVRIGDLKVPPRPNQAGSNLRGMLVEVSYMADDEDDRDEYAGGKKKDIKTGDVSKEDETLLRGFLESVTDGSGVPSILTTGTSRSLIRRTTFQEKDKSATSASPDVELANLYLDILRGSRG